MYMVITADEWGIGKTVVEARKKIECTRKDRHLVYLLENATFAYVDNGDIVHDGKTAKVVERIRGV